MRKLDRLEHELDFTKRKLALLESDCKTVMKQRDEFEKNAQDYQAALTSIVETLSVLHDGAVSRLAAAEASAYERMSDRYTNQAVAETKQ